MSCAIALHAGCPSLPGYDLYPNLVSNTSTYYSLPTADVSELAAQCSAEPACLAFTTWGDLKDGLMNYSDWSLVDSNWVFGGLPVLLSCQGMYLKLGPLLGTAVARGAAANSSSGSGSETPAKAHVELSSPPIVFSSSGQNLQVITLLNWQAPDNWTTQGSRMVFVIKLSDVVFLGTSAINQSTGIALTATTVLVTEPSVRNIWNLPTLQVSSAF